MATVKSDFDDDLKPHLSERKKKIEAYYLTLLEQSPRWSQYKDSLLYSLSIDADNVFSEYSQIREMACYPQVCRKVALSFIKKQRTRHGKHEAPTLSDILSISFLAFVDALKKDCCPLSLSYESDIQQKDLLQRYLFVAVFSRTDREYRCLVGTKDGKGGIGTNIYKGEDILFDFLLEEKDNVIDIKQYKDVKPFERAEHCYFASTGKNLSLLELDNFEKVLNKTKNKGIFFSLEEEERMGDLITSLKKYFVVSKGRAISPRGVLHNTIRKAALDGCIKTSDFEEYLKKRGVLYDVGELGQRIFLAFKDVGMQPPKRPQTRYEILSEQVNSIMDQGYLDTDSILKQLKNYPIPAYYSSTSYQSFKNNVSGMRSYYLKQKREKPKEKKTSKLKPYSRERLLEGMASISVNYQIKRSPSDFQKVQASVVQLLEEGIEKTAVIREHLKKENLLESYNNRTTQQLTAMVSDVKYRYKNDKSSPRVKVAEILEIYRETHS